MPFALFLLLLLLPAVASADSAALILGIGASRSKADALEEAPAWTIRACPQARLDAEDAFREMISLARDETHLYSYPIRWNGARRDRVDTAILLTDGVTDNRSIPVDTRVQVELRNLVRGLSRPDDFVLWVSGIGSADGIKSWIHDRIGNTLSISTLLATLPSPAENARRICIVRIYGEEPDPAGHMLFFADPRSVADFLNWLNEANLLAMNSKSPGRTESFAPGLSGLLANMTPRRLQRAIERSHLQSTPFGSLQMIDFGVALERSLQVVEIPVVSQISPIYRKEQKAGPLFTILEVETDEKIGEETLVDFDALRVELAKWDLSESVIRRIEKRIRKKYGNSFKEEFTEAKISYQLEYDRMGRKIHLSYLD
jgi:hypothetical protein